MQVPIEYVQALAMARHAINSMKLEDIEWTYKGEPAPISSLTVDNFELTGLCNVDFISSNYWLQNIPEDFRIEHDL